MSTFDSVFCRIQAELERVGHWRKLPSPEPTLRADFSHNDYLGFAYDAEIIEAAYQAAQQYGIGSTGSRLLSGNHPPHLALEHAIASAKRTQAALIFNSGYQANATALAALLDKKTLGAEPLVFADRLNHASLHHACKLMGVHQIRYRHNDLAHLRDLLSEYRDNPRPKFIITETVFGMDGDSLDIAELASLADDFNAFLYLDEAHATGVVGHDGYGLACGWIGSRGVAMGTFSKALGSSGAYIACSQTVYEYLINRCPGFIYSTALSPALIGAAHAAWQRLPSMAEQRIALLARANNLRQRLQKLGFNTGDSNTHIIPLIIGDTQTTLDLKQRLLEYGILVSVIRPPTVPPQTARLRIALSLAHQDEQIDALVSALADISPSHRTGWTSEQPPSDCTGESTSSPPGSQANTLRL